MLSEATKEKLKAAGIYILAALGALGTAVQNFAAVNALIMSIINGTLGLVLGNLIAAILGGLFSGLANFGLNLDLLKGFFKRFFRENFFGKDDPKARKVVLTTGQKIKLGVGCAVFIITGILFGMTAFAIGSLIGVLPGILIAAGVITAVIMIIQELQTWFLSFDDQDKNELEAKQSLWQRLKDWKESLFNEENKIWGFLISIGNVFALSLLFAFSLATVLMLFSVAPLTALIAGLVVAFTIGAFTEFFFYNSFLGKFCSNIMESFKAFWKSMNPKLGFVACAINALVNAVLTFTGVYFATAGVGAAAAGSLLVAAGIAIPPLGVIIAIAIAAALFAGIASYFLCLDFWTSNSNSWSNLFSASSTAAIKEELEPAKEPANEPVYAAEISETPALQATGTESFAAPSSGLTGASFRLMPPPSAPVVEATTDDKPTEQLDDCIPAPS